MENKMKKIVLQKDFAYIYLNSSFYPEKVILNTLKEYQDFFTADLKKTQNYNILKITALTNDYELEELCNEFTNYLLSNLYKFENQNLEITSQS